MLSLYVLRVAQRELHKKLDTHHHLPVSLVQVDPEAQQCNQLHASGNHTGNNIHTPHSLAMKPHTHTPDSGGHIADKVFIV